MASKCRQNYHDETDALVNQQINIELSAYYQYLAVHAFYDRDDVALKGLAKFFKELAEGENQHAHKLIEYHNLRGGRVLFTDIGRPVEQEFDTPVIAMEFALKLEKRLNQSLLDLHQVATNRSDPHLTNYLESHFLNEQAETINKVAKLHTNLVRVGDGLGVFVFDKELQ